METEKMKCFGSYEEKIMKLLRGNTPEEKYHYLRKALFTNISDKDFLDSLNYRIKEHLNK